MRRWAQQKSDNERDGEKEIQSNHYYAYRNLFKLARNCIGIVELGDALIAMKKHEQETLADMSLFKEVRFLHEANLFAVQEMLELTIIEYKQMQRRNKK